MRWPVKLYKGGRAEIADERAYARIQDGDSIVVVDSEGNAADFGKLVRQFSRDTSRPIQFTATTEHQSMYTPKKPQRFQPDAAADMAVEKWWEKTKFLGESESHAAYTPKEIEREPAGARAAPTTARTYAKFDAVSETRAMYTPKEAAREGPHELDAGPAEKWWEKTKFAGESEARAQYVPNPLEKTKFAGESEARAQYVP